MLSYRTLALVGSCFSGGLFQPLYVDIWRHFLLSSRTRRPCDHRRPEANQLAWTSLGGKGTVFFTELLKAEVNMKHPDALATLTLEGGVISGADGHTDKFLGWRRCPQYNHSKSIAPLKI